MANIDNISCQRVFKKSSPNNKVTLYLCSRDLVIENGVIDKLQGVLCVDQDVLDTNRKVFGQVTLTFRYGREDEEVMGLKFCNEAVMCLAQIFPVMQGGGRADYGMTTEPNTPLQDALLQRLGPRAHAFSMELTPLSPPSVQLVPAKEYRGAPIGTSYDVRAFVEGLNNKLDKRSTVRMAIRVVQGVGFDMHSAALTPTRDSRFMRLSPKNLKAIASPNRRTSPQLRPPSLPEESTLGDVTNVNRGRLSPIQTTPAPHAMVEKLFLLSEGKVILEAVLEKSNYSHGEAIGVTVTVNNSSHKIVRRIKVFVVQHVDVCMFSNGKFKNVVAVTESDEDYPVNPGNVYTTSFSLKPTRGNTKNWIALEDSFNKGGASLASTVLCQSNSPDDRNVFAIYVSYYVKVKITMNAMGGELSLKLPFTLQHSCRQQDPLSPNANIMHGSMMTDDILPEEIIEKCKNINDLHQIKPYKSDNYLESLQVGNITPSEDVGPTKIIVTVEDHQKQNEESFRRKVEKIIQEKCDAKNELDDEDFNMISNYDEENT